MRKNKKKLSKYILFKDVFKAYDLNKDSHMERIISLLSADYIQAEGKITFDFTSEIVAYLKFYELIPCTDWIDFDVSKEKYTLFNSETYRAYKHIRFNLHQFETVYFQLQNDLSKSREPYNWKLITAQVLIYANPLALNFKNKNEWYEYIQNNCPVFKNRNVFPDRETLDNNFNLIWIHSKEGNINWDQYVR